jgi:hypothetical protein
VLGRIDLHQRSDQMRAAAGDLLTRASLDFSANTLARGWLRKVALALLTFIASSKRVSSQNGSCESSGASMRATGMFARSQSNLSSSGSHAA